MTREADLDRSLLGCETAADSARRATREAARSLNESSATTIACNKKKQEANRSGAQQAVRVQLLAERSQTEQRMK